MTQPACIHRGSQRRVGCCGGKGIARYVCRKLMQTDGCTPKDCIPTEFTNAAIKENSPTALHEKWDDMIQVCEKCPLYEAK